LFSRTFSALQKRSWSERGLLFEALFWLAISRLSVLAIPFRYIAPLLGGHMAVTPAESNPVQARSTRLIGQSVRIVARHTPWYSNCLAQAIAAKMMLRLRGIPSTLYLGATQDDEKGLYAHAWLRCGDLIVTGGGIQDRFKVLSTFG
jgi:hypothetical protein